MCQTNKLNKNISVISLELILSFLLFISSDMETNSLMIKGILIEDHEIKIVNFADDTTVFLWDVLKLYENEKINKLNDNLAQR